MEFTKEELNEKLRLHSLWLGGKPNRVRLELRYADLSNADLRYANLSNANLRYADLINADLSNADLINADLSNADLSSTNLSNANLSSTNLSNANLRYADLINADLSNADLINADLSNADLSSTNLSGANLSNADLSSTNLSGANLRYADLRYADLSSTNLSSANLSNADLRGANLSNADLRGAKGLDPLIQAQLMTCPEEGGFIGFKKLNGYILKLYIPADAKRSSATSRKCRCSKAKVLSITTLDGKKANTDCIVNTFYGAQTQYTQYKKGEYVYPDSFDDNRWKECSNGIHFFITRQEAVDY